MRALMVAGVLQRDTVGPSYLATVWDQVQKYQISVYKEENFSQKLRRQRCFGRQEEALLAELEMNTVMCSNECQKAKSHLIHAQFKIFQQNNYFNQRHVTNHVISLTVTAKENLWEKRPTNR